MVAVHAVAADASDTAMADASGASFTKGRAAAQMQEKEKTNPAAVYKIVLKSGGFVQYCTTRIADTSGFHSNFLDNGALHCSPFQVAGSEIEVH